MGDGLRYEVDDSLSIHLEGYNFHILPHTEFYKI